jgi:RasGEF domain
MYYVKKNKTKQNKTKQNKTKQNKTLSHNSITSLFLYFFQQIFIFWGKIGFVFLFFLFFCYPFYSSFLVIVLSSPPLLIFSHSQERDLASWPSQPCTLTPIITRFNLIAQWVARSIILEPEVIQRVTVMAKFIDIASVCLFYAIFPSFFSFSFFSFSFSFFFLFCLSVLSK